MIQTIGAYGHEQPPEFYRRRATRLLTVRPQPAVCRSTRNDPHSAVARRKASPLDYVLLEELNTRPRTSYTALIRNPNPAIGGDKT